MEKTVNELIREVTKRIANAEVLIADENNHQIGQFLMQYEETDWEFIKRLASHNGHYLYIDSKQDYPAFYVGKYVSFTDYFIDENVASKICKRSYVNLNGEYSIECMVHLNDKWIYPGACVSYKGINWYVKASHTELKNAILNNYYELCSINGLSADKKYKEPLAGKSVTGVVKKIDKDYVYVNVTGINTDDACWFPYSTVYASSDGSGWYCMPEIGDTVRIQFPDKDEKNAFAISSVSQNHLGKNNDKIKNYTNRYIRNRQGMEVMWTPDRVVVSANGNSVMDINQNGTIFLSANNKITVHSGKDVVIEAGNQIKMQGGEGIHIQCGAKAEIDMDKDGVIEIKGNEVYTN